MNVHDLIQQRLHKTVQEATKEELLTLIEECQQPPAYGLVWERQREQAEELLQDYIPVLKEVKEREIMTDSTKPVQILIEGDNLHALHALLPTHKEKVDLIYLDPPYNTGNRDFRYEDRYVGREDNWKHSKWLSYMEKRLVLAKELLSERGAIFISIDDHEYAPLKLLCDHVFGERYFLGSFIRKTRSAVNDKKTNIGTNHEYLLAYSKTDAFKMAGEEKDFSNYSNPDNDPNGDWKASDPSAKSGSPSTYFPIENPFTHQADYPPTGRYWAFSPSTFENYVQNGRIVFRDSIKKGQLGFLFKTYKKDLKSTTKSIDTLYFAQNDYLNQVATKDLNELQLEFSYPKPVEFIKQLIRLSFADKNITVLDFFAGSGTTGQAVLELNAEDGGERQVILVTNNENGICEEVTYERLKHVIQGYSTPKGKWVEGVGGNVKYVQTYLNLKSSGKE